MNHHSGKWQSNSMQQTTSLKADSFSAEILPASMEPEDSIELRRS
jgi:hypothetical protein